MAADEDQILFGSNNALIADEFYDRIDAALVEGVASLPLMNKSHDDNNDDNESDTAAESRDQKMLRLLRASYTKYVDLMELYGDRNIFTVAKRTAHFRKRIVEEFHQGGEDENNNNDTVEQNGVEDSSKVENTGDDDTTKPKLKMPTSAADIPSPENMTALEEEIKTLRGKLKQARQQRVQEEKSCQELQEKADFAKASNETIDKLNNDKNVETKVPAAVQAMVEGRANLEQSQQEGKQLLQKMDNLENKKRENQEEDDDDEDPDALLAAHMAKNASKNQQRKKPKTLEDHYKEDRQVLGETQVQDLVDIKQMLHRKA